MTHYYITYYYTDKKKNPKRASVFYDTESTLNEETLNTFVDIIKKDNNYIRVVVENICYLGKDITFSLNDTEYKVNQ